jgi:hypothetical protein
MSRRSLATADAVSVEESPESAPFVQVLLDGFECLLVVVQAVAGSSPVAHPSESPAPAGFSS